MTPSRNRKPKSHKPGRRYTIDDHPKREQIIRAIVRGEDSLRRIAAQFEVSASSVRRYLKDRLLPQAAQALIERDLTTGQGVLAEIEGAMANARKMYAACDDWLTDPDHPEKYYLGPRDYEIDVVYEEPTGEVLESGREVTIRRRAPLSELIKKHVRGELIRLSTAIQDPRRSVIDTARTLTAQLETIAKIQGLVKDVRVNISISDVWVLFKKIIIEATKDNPEVLEAIVSGVEREAEPD